MSRHSEQPAPEAPHGYSLILFSPSGGRIRKRRRAVDRFVYQMGVPGSNVAVTNGLHGRDRHVRYAGEIALTIFWLSFLLGAPVLGWMSQYIRAPTLGSATVFIICAVPMITIVIMLSLSTIFEGDFFAIILTVFLAFVFEVIWIGLVALGYVFHGLRREEES